MAHRITKTALAAATALSVAVTSVTPALAWGDREQGIVTGILGTLLFQEATNTRHKPQPEPYPYPEPYPPQYGHRPPPPPPPQYHQPGYDSVYRTALGRAFASYSLGERKDIQRELRRYGYYNGRVDGQFGPGTYEAVSAYARRTGQRDANRSMAAAFGVYDSLLY
jgi:hypothetical protein